MTHALTARNLADLRIDWPAGEFLDALSDDLHRLLHLEEPYDSEEAAELICDAKGAIFYNPSIKTVMDIGGENIRVFRCNAKGRVLDFCRNDKCAAGTGRFLEAMARALEVRVEELGDLSETARGGLTLSSMCTVFAETEVASLIAEGAEVPEIVALPLVGGHPPYLTWLDQSVTET